MTQPSQTPAAGDGASSAAVSYAAASDLRAARTTWILGGSLLIANAVLVLAGSGYPLQFIPGLSFVLNGLWAAALLVFAFGVRGRGSVVARRPLGVIALVIAALVPFASLALWAMLPVGGDAAVSAMVGNGLSVLSLASMLVAAVVIGRAGAVPYRLRWVPLIVLAVGAGVQVVAQLFLVTVQGAMVRPDITALVFGTAMLGTLGVLLLGILAIVFAPREQPRPAAPTQVYPPAS